MLRLFAILITIVMLPAMAFAWPGKIVAVEEATSFVVLKNGQTPVKVNIAGVEPSPDLDPAKARMESSNNVLMRNVEVRELSKAEDGTIIGDITVNGKSLAKELLDDGIVQSTAQAAPAIDTTPVEIPKEITEPETITEQAPIPPTANADASEITQELLPEPQAQVPDTQAPARTKPSKRLMPSRNQCDMYRPISRHNSWDSGLHARPQLYQRSKCSRHFHLRKRQNLPELTYLHMIPFL